MMKKHIFAGLMALSLTSLTAPAFAITAPEAECPIADIKPEDALVKTAYEVMSNPDVSEAERASFNLVMDPKIEACKSKYNWSDTVTEDVRIYAISEMAQVGGMLKLQAELIDVEALNKKLEGANDDDWAAIKNSNEKAKIFEHMIGILVNQGFDPDEDDTPFQMLGIYMGIANVVHETAIKLSI